MAIQMPVNQQVFENVGELEEIANGLARASRHPLYADLGREYEDRVMSIGTQTKERMEQDFEQLEWHVVWNNRDDELAYIGSKKYNLVQHRDVIDALRTAVDRTVGTIDKGVIRDYGSKVDGTIVFGNQEKARIDVEELVGDGYVPPEGAEWTNDRLGLGSRFRNSFDGGMRLGGSTMGYRYICGNWLVWGEEEIAAKDQLHLRHEDESIGIDPEFFEDIINEVFDEKDYLEGVVKEAIEDGEFPTSWSAGVLEQAGFGRNYRKWILRELDSYEVGENIDKWVLFNAASHYLDSTQYQNIGNGVYDKQQGRAWKILELEPEAPEEEIDLEAIA